MKSERAVPDESLVAAIVRELAATLSVPPEAIAVERVERQIWRDGSLGCPEPGMLYAQVLIAGFRVIVGAAGRTYDYRVGRGGTFRRCEQPSDEAPLPRWDDGRQ